MLQVTPKSKIFLAIQPIDFRKGIDSISAVCKQNLETDPMSGTLFVFRNRLQTTLKILCYDGQGFWLCIKRLSSGKFKWWPKSNSTIDAINYRALQTLLYNGNPNTAGFSDDWRPLPD